MESDPENDNRHPVSAAEGHAMEIRRLGELRQLLDRLKARLKAGSITPTDFLAELDRLFGPEPG